MFEKLVEAFTIVCNGGVVFQCVVKNKGKWKGVPNWHPQTGKGLNAGGQSQNVKHTDFNIWFVFYVSLPNQIKLLYEIS